MPLDGKRVLITGGAGFIGTTLARRLVERNEIVALDNLHRDALSGLELGDHPNFTFVQADVLDGDRVAELAQGATHIVHAAGIAGIDTVIKNPVRTMQVNMIGTAERARGRPPRTASATASSTSPRRRIFGSMAFRSSEADQTVSGSAGEARWTYAVSKLAGEHLAHAYFKQHALPRS